MITIQCKKSKIEEDLVYYVTQKAEAVRDKIKKPKRKLPDTARKIFIGYSLDDTKWLPMYIRRNNG